MAYTPKTAMVVIGENVKVRRMRRRGVGALDEARTETMIEVGNKRSRRPGRRTVFMSNFR
jgi:hypothetical protein